MQYVFKVRKDVLNIEGEGACAVYGIDMIHNSVTVKSVCDLFCSKVNAENFARFCRSKNVTPENIESVAVKILDRQSRNFYYVNKYKPYMFRRCAV